MEARPTAIAGVLVLRPTVHHDQRGWFVRTFDAAAAAASGLDVSFVQHNQSRSGHGVLRGLHVRAGRGETKLVRASAGRIVDWVVDVRPWSVTFGRAERIVLDDVDHSHLVLPPFVAHGYQVVSECADVCYLHSREYEPAEELVLRWDDAALGLDWPIVPAVVSERDASAPRLADLALADLFER